MVTKKMDDLGRIVIPKEFRQQLGIEEGESLEISIQDNQIIIEREASALTKEEYQGAVQETIEDIQDYLGKVSELLEELQHLD